MRTISVYPETHRLAKELSLSTDKSMHKVVAEALLEYQQQLSGSRNLMLNRFLQQVPKAVEEELKLVLVKEIPKAVREVVEEIREQQVKEAKEAATAAEHALAHGTEVVVLQAHPTKPWLDGSPESDDIQELVSDKALDV